MDELIANIAEYAYPSQESIKDSDFSANVKSLSEYIISIFRNLSLEYVPLFLNGFLIRIESDAKSDEKRRRYSAAVCLSSLIDLFPIDEYIRQYKRIVGPLLIPGYKPILHIGAIVVGRLALAIGDSKDFFLHNLMLKCFNDLRIFNGPDIRYAAAVIWCELAKTVPEIFYTLESFKWIIWENLQSGDRIISELLINVLYYLFTSESSSVGSDFLIELQDLLISTTSKKFSDSTEPDKLIIYFQMLIFLLKFKPYFSKKMAENLIFSKCITLLTSQNFEIMMYSIETIIRLYEFHIINVDQKLYNDIINILFKWSLEGPMNTLQIFKKVLLAFPTYLDETSEAFVKRLNDYLKIQDGPLFAYNLIIACVASLPAQSNILCFLKFVIKMMPISNVPIPIYTLLSTLNAKHPKRTLVFVYFLNQIMYIIRQELISQSSNTIRLNISLLALLQIPIRDLDDALELNSLIMGLANNKDIQVREKIAETSFHLFANMPDKIPLNTIIKLVKFTLDDTSRSVRLNSIRAFKPMTYKLLSQPDVFPIFSKLAYDESPEVRKEALLIFTSLPAVTGTVVRNLLLSSLKQIISEKECLTSETISMWIVFPRLLVAATPWLNIYAEAIFDKFITILNHRFTSLSSCEAALAHMNSTMFQEMDESLIKSLTKLYKICPDMIDIKQILEVYVKILTCPVHPRTKIHVLKSLKNLGKVAAILKIMPNIANIMIEIILTSKSHKLVAKAMKVIGTIGFTSFQGEKMKYLPFFFRNSLKNQKILKYFFISNLVHFLNEKFKSTNIEKNRENIAKVITVIFKSQPEMIARYLEPFFNTYLKFIHDSKERPPIFFKYLKKIIKYSGHLMMEKAKKIYHAIKKDWQSSGPMTKESSEVFRSLVIATIGQCEVILNTIISESFFLLKITTKSNLYATEIFELLKTIAQLSPSYLSTIISGISEFLNPSYSSDLQELSLDAFNFMVRNCKIDNHLSFIKRCISSILLRPQQRLKDKAANLLKEANSITKPQSIEKFVSDFSYKNKNAQIEALKKPSIKEIEEIHELSLNISKFIIHLDIKRVSENYNINQWFIDLSNLLLPPSSSELIKAMGTLQEKPKFAFKFAFIQIWNNLEVLTQKEITKKLEAIFKYDKLPEYILARFTDLIEFSVLCEIDLGVDIYLVAQKCEEAHLYDKALFFLETYLLNNDESTISTKFKHSLICMNQIIGRFDDSSSLAIKYKDVMTHKIWMNLGEWETALQQIDSKETEEEDSSYYIVDRIICYAALDDWQSILKLSDQFEKLSIVEQSYVAQYFYTAKSYNKNVNFAPNSLLNQFNLSFGYSVEECIEKAILNIKENNIARAYDYVHLGWRFASASISVDSNNNNYSDIEKLLFQAQQLRELNNVISIIRNDKSEKSDDLLRRSNHVWQIRLKYLKSNPIYQKELYKVCSLIGSENENLEVFAFKILESTSKGKYAPLIPKMIDIFFPNPNSDQSKFAHICYLHDSDEEARTIYERTNDEILKKLINKFIGKKIYVDATKPEDLDKSFEYFQKANSDIKTLIKCIILLAYVKNDVKYAEKVVELLSDPKIKLTPIQFHILLVLLANFDISLDKVISQINYSVLQSAIYTTILLLNHESENVKNCCKQILPILCLNCPQLVTYDLVNNIHLQGAKDLILQLQSYNPTISSQLILISKKLTSISNNLYEKWISTLKNAYDLAHEDQNKEAMTMILNLKNTLEISDYVSISKYNKEFIETFRETLLSLISQIEQNAIQQPEQQSNDHEHLSLLSNMSSDLSYNSSYDLESALFIDSVGKFNFEAVNLLITQMVKKQASLRVIPMSSFDEEIEKKNDWVLNVFGLKDIKISKINNCIQRQENGFKVTFIGSNGKKYNFSLENSNAYFNEHFSGSIGDDKNLSNSDSTIARRIKISEQFMELINSTINTSTKLVNRTIVELSHDVFLIDQLKGHITLYDLIVSYYSSSHIAKENSLSYEMISYMKNIHSNSNTSFTNNNLYKPKSSKIEKKNQPFQCLRSSSNSDFYNRFLYTKKFKELQDEQDPRAIAKAIVATSKNSMSWIQRSSTFVKSYGTLSFMSYIMGNLDMSLYSIAFDKSTAAVSYTAFIASGRPQIVPFRMTKMIIGALGSSCSFSSSRSSNNDSSNSRNVNENNNSNNTNNNNNNENNNNNNENNNNNNTNNNNNNENNSFDGSAVDTSKIASSDSILVSNEAKPYSFKSSKFFNDKMSAIDEHVSISGPFVSSFSVSMRSIRRQKNLFAPCLQLLFQQDTMSKKVLPSKFIKRFVEKESAEEKDKEKSVYTDNDDINQLFGRIDGEKATINDDLNKLISEASSINNLIRMPANWIPWW